jgi:hypothetical protein
MTTQMSDIFKLNNQEYNVANIDGNELFNIKDFGLEAFPCCSACWRGHLCKYAIKNSQLILDELLIFFGDYDENNDIVSREGSLINGVKPIFKQNLDDDYIEDDMHFFNNKYQNMNLQINFTGGILIASDWEFISWDYFIPAWQYQNALELTFENGKVLSIQDVSQEMGEFREEYPYSKFALLSFTEREETILKLLAEGLLQSEIATHLDKSMIETNFYIQKFLEKSEIDDFAKLIKYAKKYYDINQNQELLLKLEYLRKYFHN